MTKYVFCGDIHGKWEHVERALAMDGKKIFVGDFIDSFDRSVEDHKKCYDLVFDAIDNGEAEAIFGNHELSYIFPHHRCSGYESKRKYLMDMYRNIIVAKFKPYILLNPTTLISHAGLTEQVWDNHGVTFEALPVILRKWWKDMRSPMHYIGESRGGMAKWGGMFWCDWREFRPVPGLTQIFGHTAGKHIRQEGNNWCIDCLDYTNEFLVKEFE